MSYLFLRVERDGAELSFFILQPTQIIFRFKSSLQIFVPRSFFLNGELWSLLLMTNFIQVADGKYNYTTLKIIRKAYCALFARWFRSRYRDICANHAYCRFVYLSNYLSIYLSFIYLSISSLIRLKFSWLCYKP